MQQNEQGIALLGEIKIVVVSDDGKRVEISKDAVKCDDGMSCLVTHSEFIQGWEKATTLICVLSDKKKEELKKAK